MCKRVISTPPSQCQIVSVPRRSRGNRCEDIGKINSAERPTNSLWLLQETSFGADRPPVVERDGERRPVSCRPFEGRNNATLGSTGPQVWVCVTQENTMTQGNSDQDAEEKNSNPGNVSGDGHLVHVNDQDEIIKPDRVPAARLIELGENGNASGYILEALTGRNGTMVTSFKHEEHVTLTNENREWFRTVTRKDRKT